MPLSAQRLRRLRTPQRWLVVFAATVAGPALLLGFFGVRALVQERDFVRRQVQDRMRASAEAMGRRAELEFAAWQQAIDQVALAGVASPGRWPDRIRKAVDGSSSAVVLTESAGVVAAIPAANLLYRVGSPPPNPASRLPVSPLLAEAESLELRLNKFDQAAELYRRVLASSGDTPAATIALHRLGRTLKKAGRNAEAVAVWEKLRLRPPTPIGSLPSDLLARIALLDLKPSQAGPALDLYRDLTVGRWRLAKSSYLFYSEKVRGLLPPSAAAEGEQIERRKMTLTWAVERFLESPRRISTGAGAAFVAVWRSEPFVAIVVAEPSLGADFWPTLFGAPLDRELDFSVAASDGPLLFGPAPLASHAVEQMVQLPGLPLRLTVWPKDPEALLRRGAARQNFYLGMVGGIVALLALGSYLAVRTVRAELAVAQMKAGFVSTVSHEFRSPLAGINQLAEMLRDGRVEDGEQRQHYYEMIVSETQRLRRLVENILDFSRMEEKRKQYRFEPFDTGAWLEGLAGGFRKELAASRCELSVSIPADLPRLAGDREALTTAVHNLLDNAAKYSNGSTGIRLEARTEGADLLISVHDRGAGIADKDKPHVFEKFYRGAATAREVKGAGLGLSLVRHIVLAHGGQVTFDSRQGEGSTFTIRLAAGR